MHLSPFEIPWLGGDPVWSLEVEGESSQEGRDSLESRGSRAGSLNEVKEQQEWEDGRSPEEYSCV